jgi:oxazoline/thiazoline synthase
MVVQANEEVMRGSCKFQGTATFRPIETRLGSGGLAFAPRFRVETIDGEAVFLLSERGHVVLRGDAYLHLAPLLDGQRDVAALVDALDGVVPAAEVYFAINRMLQQGYIVDAEVAGDRAGWWNELGVDATEAERRLGEATVAVLGFGG